MDLERLKADLVRDEGIAERREDKPGRLFPYRDSKGILTIAVGRNLQDKGVSEAEGMLMLDNDIAEHLALLDRELPWWLQLDEPRQLVLANMAFNLGVGPTAEQPEGKLLTFKTSLRLIQTGQYAAAADRLAGTPWAKQVGVRATRLLALLRT